MHPKGAKGTANGMPTLEERLTRWEQRQELMVSSMEGMLDIMVTTRDMITELSEWLKQPPSSDLPDLLKVLIAKIDALPEAVARAVKAPPDQ